jgi:cytosine/adenosine deaminase-related metal-dependent hydrolase
MQRDLVVENADLILSGPAGQDYSGGSIMIKAGVIDQFGSDIEVLADVPRLDASGCVVIPGLINTHHHMFQCLTRTVGHDSELFGWLSSLWPTWLGHDAEWEHAATMLAGAELLLSGCTTTADHHYLPSRGDTDPLVAQAEAAGRLGIRLTQAIGGMDVSDVDGGLAPPELCESIEDFLSRAAFLISAHHDPNPGASLQVALAPCHALAVTDRYAAAARDLAREHGLRLHTHMAEARGEEQATLDALGLRPLELLESWGLVGPDVWLAHCVQLSDRDIQTLAATGTSVSSCPSSNLRLGSGIARVRDLLDAGVTVSLGTDGSASNDTGNALAEARLLLLASRANGVARGITPDEALRIATAHGAAALGRTDIGRIEVGQRADLAIFSRDAIESIGTEADPLAGLLLAPPTRARDVIVDGEFAVKGGELVNVGTEEIRATARSVLDRMVSDHS